jgi:hypothetical protein
MSVIEVPVGLTEKEFKEWIKSLTPAERVLARFQWAKQTLKENYHGTRT